MAKHNLTEAASLTGKSRRTIQRYAKSGKLSTERDRNGNPTVATAELIRVFGELSHHNSKGCDKKSPSVSHDVAVTNYDDIALIISKAIIEANKPLYEEISALTEQVKHLTHRLEKPKSATVKESEGNITEPIVKNSEISNYLDDIPAFVGSKK